MVDQHSIEGSDMTCEKAEIALYEKHRDHYSYGVYIAKKCKA